MEPQEVRLGLSVMVMGLTLSVVLAISGGITDVVAQAVPVALLATVLTWRVLRLSSSTALVPCYLRSC